MDKFIKEDLEDIIVRCKTANPQRYNKKPQTYFQQLETWAKNNSIDNEYMRIAIHAFNRENEHASKLSLEYLMGILKGQLKDRIIQKKRESRCLGGLPDEIR